MTEFHRISHSPKVMGGLACLGETHITVATVTALVSGGRTEKDILRMFPMLTSEDVREALAYAAWAVDEVARLQQSHPEGIAKNGNHVEIADPAVDTNLTEGDGNDTSDPLAEPEPMLNGHSMNGESQNGETTENSEGPNGTDASLEPSMDELDTLQRLELYHPSYPDQPTIIIGREGLLDRRWHTSFVAWCDIKRIDRIRHEKGINFTLRNPGSYIASMPFLMRIQAKLNMAMKVRFFRLDTASLGTRTSHIYYIANQFWMRHRGDIKVRRKHRKRSHHRKVTVMSDDFDNKGLW